MSRKEATPKAVELLERVGIPDPKARLVNYPHQLSGGMRQRALIAMALACSPRLLIADEPTTALDVTIQAQILALLKELVVDTGTALVMITHDLGVVAGLCDEVNVLYGGRIVERGGRHGLFQRPRHPYTVGLLNSIPRLDAPRGERLTPMPGSVADNLPWDSACAFAPRCPNVVDVCTQETPGGTATRSSATAASTRWEDRGERAAHDGGDPSDPSADVLVEVTGLEVHFPIKSGLLFDRTVGHVRAVDGVDLSIRRGETYGLVGESGCGKSTLGKAILNLEPPTAGSRRLRRRRHRLPQGRGAAPERKRFQMVFQDPLSSLDPRQTVESLLAGGPACARPRHRQGGDPHPAARADVGRRPAGGRAQQVPARVLRRPAPAHRHRAGPVGRAPT